MRGGPERTMSGEEANLRQIRSLILEERAASHMARAMLTPDPNTAALHRAIAVRLTREAAEVCRGTEAKGESK